MLAALVLLQAQAPTLAITSIEYRSGGTTQTIDTPQTLVAPMRGGHLVLRADFQLPQVNGGAPGIPFPTPDLGVFWKLSDGVGIAQRIATDDSVPRYWAGEEEPIDVTLTSFNSNQGSGKARLRIPVGLTSRNGVPRVGLPFPEANVSLVLGPREELSLDSTGNPIGEYWSASVTIQTVQPSAVVLLSDNYSPPGGLVEGIFVFSSPLDLARNIRIEPTVDGSGIVDHPQHSLDAGEQHCFFRYEPMLTGDHALRAIDASTGEELARTGILRVADDLALYGRPAGLLLAGALDGSLPNAEFNRVTGDGLADDLLAWNFGEICIPPKCISAPPGGHRECGPCGSPPPLPDCTDDEGKLYTESRCSPVIIHGDCKPLCKWNSSWEQATLKCKNREIFSTPVYGCFNWNIGYYFGLSSAREKQCCWYIEAAGETELTDIKTCFQWHHISPGPGTVYGDCP